VNYFITGTDTGVGKTYVASLLVRGLRNAGLDSVAMKPICCGDRTDAELLREASGARLTLDEINPVWLSAPAAPLVAADMEKCAVDLDLIRAAFARLRRSHRSILVEGAGGWLVPIRRDYFVADLAADFGLPVLVVVRNRLGAINHTLLTVRAIQSRGLQCAGIVLNNLDDEPHVATKTNRAIIEDLSGVPVLFEIERNQRAVELAVA
jgi:dethiobiotin synthetase